MSSTLRCLLSGGQYRDGCVPPESAHRQTAFADLEPREQEDLRQALARFTESKRFPGPDSWRPIWVLKKPRSVILLVELGTGGQRLILKRQRAQAYGASDRARDAAAREFEYGQRAQGTATSAQVFRTPRVLGHYPDLSTDAYEYISGASLQTILLHAGRFFGSGARRALSLVGRIAEALSSYQESNVQHGGSLDPARLTTRFAENWRVFSYCYPTLAAPIRTGHLLAWCQEQWTQLAPEDLAPVYCHGDFGPGNMIATPEGRLIIIDFASGQIASRLTDACYFLHQLWRLSLNPIVQREFAARARLTFSQHYGASKLLPAALYRLEAAYCYTAALRRFVRKESQATLLSSVHDRWLVSACLRSLRQIIIKGSEQTARL